MKTKLLLAALLLVGIGAASAQDAVAVIPFENTSRPGTLRMEINNGDVMIEGYNGSEVRVRYDSDEVIVDSEWVTENRNSNSQSRGLRRIGGSSPKLDISQRDNTITIRTSSRNSWRGADLHIQVPHNTSITAKVMMNGDIEIEDVAGEIELDSHNGDIDLMNVRGTAIINSMNGEITAHFRDVAADKPMSFTSMNGEIDVTLPGGTKANVILRTHMGDIYTDFDVRLGERPTNTENRWKAKKSDMYGTINGGGPEMLFSSFNGSIYIRQGN